MAYKCENNAAGQLNANITDSQTTIQLKSGEGAEWPSLSGSDWTKATLVDSSGNREIVKVTARSGDVLTVERGAEGTTAQAFSLDDVVSCRLTAAEIESLVDDIVDLMANLYAPANTVMYFYNDTAPSGWTASALSDRLLALKGGSAAYNVSGGNYAGTWTPTGHTHTGPSHTHTGPLHTHTTGSHALTTAEMPAHTHNIKLYSPQGTGGDNKVPTSLGSNTHNQSTDSAGSGTAHNHGVTGGDGTGNTGASGTGATGSSGAPATDRPAAVVGILATKD